MLDIPDIIQDDGIVFRPPLEDLGQFEISFSNKELLHKQIAGHKSNASALIDEFLGNGTQKVRFSAARISESQNIFSSVQEGTVQKRID